MPPEPVSRPFLRLVHHGIPPKLADGAHANCELGRLIYLTFDWSSTNSVDDADLAPRAPQHAPVPLSHLIRSDSPWDAPTTTQLVTLILGLVRDMESLSKTTFYCPTLDSILIVNPSQSGRDRPFDFRLCPFNLFLCDESEKPPSHSREQMMMYSMSILCLQLATRLEHLLAPDLLQRAIAATTSHPGLMAIFMVLFAKSCPPADAHALSKEDEPRLDKIIGPLSQMMFPSRAPDITGFDASTSQACSLSDASRTLRVMRNIAKGAKFPMTTDDLAGLIEVLQCVDSIHLHGPAAEAIWRMMLGASKRDLALIVNILSNCIAAVVPRGTASLIVPCSSERSAPWILRMNIIDRVLFELERSAEYGKLRRTQQTLLEAGIGNQLGSALAGHGQNFFSFKVLMPMVRVATMASFHFPPLRERLIFDHNVRRMANMTIEACREPRKDIHPLDMARFVGMMMVMSNFWDWKSNSANNEPNGTDAASHPQSTNDAVLQHVWDAMDSEIFLLYVLPCWHAATSRSTTVQVVKKMEVLCLETAKALVCDGGSVDGPSRQVLDKKLSYILDWLCNIAWNGPAQVAAASYHSLYASYFASMVFRAMSPFIILRLKCQREAPLLLHGNESARSNDAAEALHDWAVSCDAAPEVAADWASKMRERVLLGLGAQPSQGSDASLDIAFMPSVISDAAVVSALLVDMQERHDECNPESLPWALRQFKLPLTEKALLGFVRLHKDSLATWCFKPQPQNHGAPDLVASVFLELPEDRLQLDLAYHIAPTAAVECANEQGATTRTLRSNIIALSKKAVLDNQRIVNPAVAAVYKGFEPITLVARNPLCHTQAQLNVPIAGQTQPGTTGMFEVRIVDSGETNQLVIGLAWESIEHRLAGGASRTLIPGRCSSSLGLEVSTGCVYYVAENGKQIKLPYVVPIGTGSVVRIGIAFRYVYLVVDDVFYPPLPSDPSSTEGAYFMLPDNVNVHGVVRLGCSGIKLATCAMSRHWPVDMHCSMEDLHATYAVQNPLAYTLFSAQQRARSCRHAIAQADRAECIPKLVGLGTNDELFGKLDEKHQEMIRRIQMASEPCEPSTCRFSAYVHRTINTIIHTANNTVQPKAASPETSQ